MSLSWARHRGKVETGECAGKVLSRCVSKPPQHSLGRSLRESPGATAHHVSLQSKVEYTHVAETLMPK